MLGFIDGIQYIHDGDYYTKAMTKTGEWAGRERGEWVVINLGGDREGFSGANLTPAPIPLG